MKTDNEYHRTRQRRGCIFIVITALARICGLVTLIGLGFVTYLECLRIDSENLPIYIIIVTIIVGYLELLWVLDKCMSCCICCFRSETCLFWICCIPLDTWLRAVIYISLSIPFFVPPTWLFNVMRTDVQVIGILLMITSLLYFIKTFKYKTSNIDNKLVDTSNSFPRSIPTQTSTTAIDNDTLSSSFTTYQVINLEH